MSFHSTASKLLFPHYTWIHHSHRRRLETGAYHGRFRCHLVASIRVTAIVLAILLLSAGYCDGLTLGDGINNIKPLRTGVATLPMENPPPRPPPWPPPWTLSHAVDVGAHAVAGAKGPSDILVCQTPVYCPNIAYANLLSQTRWECHIIPDIARLKYACPVILPVVVLLSKPFAKRYLWPPVLMFKQVVLAQNQRVRFNCVSENSSIIVVCVKEEANICMTKQGVSRSSAMPVTRSSKNGSNSLMASTKSSAAKKMEVRKDLQSATTRGAESGLLAFVESNMESKAQASARVEATSSSTVEASASPTRAGGSSTKLSSASVTVSANAIEHTKDSADFTVEDPKHSSTAETPETPKVAVTNTSVADAAASTTKKGASQLRSIVTDAGTPTAKPRPPHPLLTAKNATDYAKSPSPSINPTSVATATAPAIGTMPPNVVETSAASTDTYMENTDLKIQASSRADDPGAASTATSAASTSTFVQSNRDPSSTAEMLTLSTSTEPPTAPKSSATNTSVGAATTAASPAKVSVEPTSVTNTSRSVAMPSDASTASAASTSTFVESDMDPNAQVSSHVDTSGSASSATVEASTSPTRAGSPTTVKPRPLHPLLTAKNAIDYAKSSRFQDMFIILDETEVPIH